MISIYEHPSYTLNQFSEYVDLVRYYLNSKTLSVPIRYFNIDMKKSIYDENALSTFNQFKHKLSGIYYNVYEFTPAFYTSPLIYATTFEFDKDGSRFSAPLSISTYTIEKVYIGDLVQFYEPNTQKHVFFRVSNYRVPLNTIDKLPIYEIDLEPAPIDVKVNDDNSILASININKRYIYDYSIEKYILYEDFIKKYYIHKFLEEKISLFLNSKLNSLELIEIYNDKTNQNEIYYEINYYLYKKISNYNKKFKQLVKIKIPFGYKFYLPKVIDENEIIDYKKFNIKGAYMHKFDLKSSSYEKVFIDPPNLDFKKIDKLIENQSLNLDDFKTDIEKIILTLYLIEKLEGENEK